MVIGAAVWVGGVGVGVRAVVGLGCLGGVVGVVVLYAIDGVWGGGVGGGDAVFLGELFVFDHCTVLTEAHFGSSMGRVQIYEVSEEEDVQKEGDGPFAHCSCAYDFIASIVAWICGASANAIADDESDSASDCQT